jgi:hypothetical protein
MSTPQLIVHVPVPRWRIALIFVHGIVVGVNLAALATPGSLAWVAAAAIALNATAAYLWWTAHVQAVECGVSLTVVSEKAE